MAGKPPSGRMPLCGLPKQKEASVGHWLGSVAMHPRATGREASRLTTPLSAVMAGLDPAMTAARKVAPCWLVGRGATTTTTGHCDERGAISPRALSGLPPASPRSEILALVDPPDLGLLQEARKTLA